VRAEFCGPVEFLSLGRWRSGPIPLRLRLAGQFFLVQRAVFYGEIRGRAAKPQKRLTRSFLFFSLKRFGPIPDNLQKNRISESPRLQTVSKRFFFLLDGLSRIPFSFPRMNRRGSNSLRQVLTVDLFIPSGFLKTTAFFCIGSLYLLFSSCLLCFPLPVQNSFPHRRPRSENPTSSTFPFFVL